MGLKHGNLFWLSDHFKRWKEVYVVLHQNEIHIYATKGEDLKLTNKVLVTGCSVAETEAKDVKRPFLFKMTQPQLGAGAVFAAATKEELVEWISAIRAVVNLTCIPESRLKLTQENNTLFKEFNAIVMMVDQIIQLLPAVFNAEGPEEAAPGSPRFKIRSPRKSMSLLGSPKSGPSKPSSEYTRSMPSLHQVPRSASSGSMASLPGAPAAGMPANSVQFTGIGKYIISKKINKLF